jgi:DNA-binding response OmpR family regulator
VATTHPSERPALTLAPDATTEVAGAPIDEAEADRLYAEAMAAARRAARVAADLERAAAQAPQPGWQLAAASCRRAEGNLRSAAEAVPEMPVDATAEPRRALVIDPLSIDRLRRVAFWEGRPLALTRLEFDLLVALAERAGEVMHKDDLLRQVWGYAGRARTRTVDSHASRLRRSLIAVGAPGTIIVNVWGIGYRLVVPDSERAA